MEDANVKLPLYYIKYNAEIVRVHVVLVMTVLGLVITCE